MTGGGVSIETSVNEITLSVVVVGGVEVGMSLTVITDGLNRVEVIVVDVDDDGLTVITVGIFTSVVMTVVVIVVGIMVGEGLIEIGRKGVGNGGSVLYLKLNKLPASSAQALKS